jgi:hypothetical protein
VPESPHLYPYLTGREYLQLVGRLRGLVQRKLDSKSTICWSCSSSVPVAIPPSRRIRRACGRRC